MKKVMIGLQIFVLMGAWITNGDLAGLFVLDHIVEHSHSHHDVRHSYENGKVKVSHSHGHTHADSEDSDDSDSHEHQFSFTPSSSFILMEDDDISLLALQESERVDVSSTFSVSSPDLDGLFRPPLA